MTLERTRRKCARPDCPHTFRRDVSRGHVGRPQIYCCKACVGLHERELEKASVVPRRRRENKRRVAAENWSWD